MANHPVFEARMALLASLGAYPSRLHDAMYPVFATGLSIVFVIAIYDNQNGIQILTKWIAHACQQLTTNHVGKSGQKEGFFHRLLKMSQFIGGVNSGGSDTGVHPTGTSIFNYRRNRIFCIADSSQRRAKND